MEMYWNLWGSCNQLPSVVFFSCSFFFFFLNTALVCQSSCKMRCGIYMNNYIPLQSSSSTKMVAFSPEQTQHRKQMTTKPTVLWYNFFAVAFACLFALIAVAIKYSHFWNVECGIAREWIFEQTKNNTLKTTKSDKCYIFFSTFLVC